MFTNDAGRGLDGCKVAYAEGYDGSALGGGGSLCLLGRSLAEELGVRPGDTVSLISHQKYTFLKELYEVEYQEKERFQTALSQEDKMYTVAGILEAEDEGANASVFAAAGEAAEEVVGNPFSVGTCEFSLADNEKADELNLFLDEQNKRGKPYTLGSSYYVDTSGLENIRRICALLGALFPVAVAAAALLGLLGPALVILQSAKEAALLRILGVTKRRACCMLVLEQAVLGLAGIVLVAAGLALCSPGLLVRGADTLAFCYALYFLAYACGASIAAAQATRRRRRSRGSQQFSRRAERV